MSYNQIVVPMLPGYALGGIISKWNLLLPYYEKKRGDLIQAQENLELHIKHIQGEKARPGEESQTKVNSLVAKKLKNKTELEATSKIIEECINKGNDIGVEWALPLDERYSKVITENRSFRSERLEQLQFKSNQLVLPQIQELVDKLFLQDVSATILPSGALESLARNVEDMLDKTKIDTSVTLIGSFITSERVRLISPLRLRLPVWLSEDLKRNPGNYYVLSEAVLGGVFLGIGRSFAQVDPQILASNPSSLEEKWKNSLISVKFISQGAIPKINQKIEEVNLWTVYTDWKNSILDDVNSGYPIGFKVRSLTEVLAENEIDVDHLLE